MTVLRVVFFAQLLVMLSAFAMLVVTPVSLRTVGLMLELVIVAAVLLVFALWQFIRHPSRRGWALATAATPLVCLTVPFLITRLNGGAIEPVALLIGVITIAVFVFVVLLSRPGLWGVGGVFNNKRRNRALLIALGVLLALYWLPLIGLSHESISLPSDLQARDRVLQVAGIYLASVAGPGFLLAVFALLYAPIGLMRNPGGRLLHVGQLVVALLILGSLAIGALVIGIAMVNPG